MLNSITDPRGLTTTIGYTLEQSTIAPYMVTMEAVRAYKVIMPNGVKTYFVNTGIPVPTDSYYYGATSLSELAAYSDIAYSQSTPFQSGYLEAYASSGSGTPYFEVGMAGVGGYDSPGITGGTTWRKQYDSQTQNLIYQVQYCSPLTNTLTTNRAMNSTNDGTKVEVSDTYNFMGNKLSETTTEATHALPTGGTYTNTRVQTTDYAYWGADKYFQQKASRTQTGASTYRYTFTDYYDSSSAAGVRGQTKAGYSPAFTSFSTTQGSQPNVPTGTDSSDYWRYWLLPTDLTTAAAKFYDGSGNPKYDSQGRCTDVWKLQDMSTTPWKYVQTHTTYNDASGHWGQAETVVEDYGTGHINRTTTTNGYTSWGTANDVTDPAGHRFYTDYDGDGKVNSVTETDCTPNKAIVSYSYGTGKMTDSPHSTTNGQPVTVTDGLSGVVQTIGYNATANDGGIGQPSSVSENDPDSVTYDSSCVYDATGSRSRVVYSKNSTETARWGYADYVPVGDPSGPSRVFQTLVKLDTSNNPTAEEFHYAYDGAGQLLIAGFAQSAQSGYTPSSGNSYYDSSHPAATRARAYYVYDAGGRMTQLNYWWDTWNSGTSSYGTPEAIISNTCAYEVSTGTSNYNRGLKTTSNLYYQNPSNHATFSLDHSEIFGYDNSRDYLTSASYDGGSTTTTWSYDAAGNRNDATVDNLNRATTISSVSRTYDILGNTATIGSTKNLYWDVLNRMTSFVTGSTTMNYAYRADGMRVSKAAGTQTVTYEYEGQMPIEERLVDTATSSNSYTIRYGLGARGIDRIETANSSATSVGYPIYDSHGNMLTTLSRAGSGYTYPACRLYDVWGGIRSGSTTGTPNGRHCANLGHLQDDESGLVYMRARHYDPLSGRFLSSDPGRHGPNWYVYAGDNPVSMIDYNGRMPLWAIITSYLFADIMSLLGMAFCTSKMLDAWAEEAEGAEVLSWAGGIAVFLVLGIWGGANTVQSFVNASATAGYRAGLSGHGDQLLDMVTKVKSTGPFGAQFGCLLEMWCWLGIIDSDAG